jgi:hypothetical protein
VQAVQAFDKTNLTELQLVTVSVGVVDGLAVDDPAVE